MSGLGNQAANLLREHLQKMQDRATLQWGVVTGVSANGVKFRPLAADNPTQEEYAWIAGQVPVIGDNVAYALMGSTWVVLGVIGGDGGGGGGGTAPTYITDMLDVSDTAGTPNQILVMIGSVWTPTAPLWLPLTGGTINGSLNVTGNTDIDHLVGVSSTIPVVNQYLRWNGTEYAPSAFIPDLTSTSIKAFMDVSDASPGVNNTLIWDGSQYSPQSISSTFVQGTAQATWVIDHALAFQPNVAIVDSAGDQVEGTVTYTSGTRVTVKFSAAFAGTAYLS